MAEDKENREPDQETIVTTDAESPKKEVTPETRRSIARLILGGFIKEVPNNGPAVSPRSKK